MMNLADLRRYPPDQLRTFAQSLGVESANLKREQIILEVFRHAAAAQRPIFCQGVVEVLPDRFGFLRYPQANYLPGVSDVYITPKQISEYCLQTGDVVEGFVSPPQSTEQYFSLERMTKVNFDEPGRFFRRIPFENLTPIFPTRKLSLELDIAENFGASLKLAGLSALAKKRTQDMMNSQSLTLRAIELIAPLGLGQRAIIVAPPRAGKTMILEALARAIQTNHPEIYLIVMLIDERPEEVTEMQRFVEGEVVSSTFDEPAARHVQIAEMVLEKAKRLVECKRDVVIFMDSLTRLARAYNAVLPSSGKVLTGGVDSNALQRPKRIFGAARNVEEGGSLTIIATALVETGSRMDEVIFEEFKGTGNAEIYLDRKLGEKRVFPALDLGKSGTRKEELLVDPELLHKRWVLRRVLSSMSNGEAVEFLLEKLSATKNNCEFFDLMNRPSGK